MIEELDYHIRPRIHAVSIDDPILGSASYLLLKAGTHVAAVFEAAVAEIDLSARDVLVLSFVSTTEGLSQQDLSARLGLDPTHVVGLVDGLEGRGLMERSRSPVDRRRNLLRLTPTGTALRDRAIEAASAVQDSFLGPLSAAERAELRSLLHKIMSPRLSWL
jgi:DNA-binding MarR family transcriptional regulator